MAMPSAASLSEANVKMLIDAGKGPANAAEYNVRSDSDLLCLRASRRGGEGSSDSRDQGVAHDTVQV